MMPPKPAASYSTSTGLSLILASMPTFLHAERVARIRAIGPCAADFLRGLGQSGVLRGGPEAFDEPGTRDAIDPGVLAGRGNHDGPRRHHADRDRRTPGRYRV